MKKPYLVFLVISVSIVYSGNLDKINRACIPFDTIEVRYDDGSPETWYTVGMDFNDKAAVRFSSPYLTPPSRVLKARILFNASRTIDHVLLCRGSYAEPDTTPAAVYQRIDNVNTLSQPNWTIINFDSNLCRITTQYTWLVVCWPNSSTGPAIGGDQTFPIDNCSAWYSEDFGWVPLTNMDLMMRILASRQLYDVTPVSVDCPRTYVKVDTPYSVKATIRNQGMAVVSYPVHCDIRRLDNSQVYAASAQVNNHGPNTNVQVTFVPDWTPSDYEDHFTIKIITDLSNDGDRTNDTLRFGTDSYGWGEIGYDDFVPEAWRVVGMPTDSSHYLAVRFTPYVPFADYFRFRFYVNSTDTLKNVKFCPDSLGKPNLMRPYLSWNNISAPAAPGWVDVSFIAQPTPGDHWLTVNYRSSSSGPAIGADTNALINQRSYFSSDRGATWIQITNQDLIMRIFHRPRVMVEEQNIEPRQIIRLYENPVRSLVRIEIPEKHCRVCFYDICGIKLKEMRVANQPCVRWDFRDENKRLLPKGIYFYQIDLDQKKIRGKIVKLE